MRFISVDEIELLVGEYILEQQNSELDDEQGYYISHLQFSDLDIQYQDFSWESLFESIIQRFITQRLIKIESQYTIPMLYSGGGVIEDEKGDCYDSGYRGYFYKVASLSDFQKHIDLLSIKHPKHKNPLLRRRSLELIARKIGELTYGSQIVKILSELGVHSSLIKYPNTKWRMVYDVIEYLAFSNKDDDKNLLFKIIAEFLHPLFYKGDRTEALKTQDYFNLCLEYDGYSFQGGVVSLVSDGVTPSLADEEISKLSYKDGILHFGQIKIDFSKKYNQKDLLATLFKDPARNWSYDEIQEDWDAQYELLEFKKKDPNWWRKFYTAGDEIEKSFSIETGMKGIIIKSTKEIKINPKYL